MNNDSFDNIVVSLTEEEMIELLALHAVQCAGASCDSYPPFFPHVTVDRKKYEKWKANK